MVKEHMIPIILVGGGQLEVIHIILVNRFLLKLRVILGFVLLLLLELVQTIKVWILHLLLKHIVQAVVIGIFQLLLQEMAL